MGVPPPLSAEEGLPKSFLERVRFKGWKRASIDETSDPHSKTLEGGMEVRLDVGHRRVVLIGERAPFLVRQGHLEPRIVSGTLRRRRESGSLEYM